MTVQDFCGDEGVSIYCELVKGHSGDHGASLGLNAADPIEASSAAVFWEKDRCGKTSRDGRICESDSGHAGLHSASVGLDVARWSNAGPSLLVEREQPTATERDVPFEPAVWEGWWA